ncbi:MAG: 50S ribosomal protein L19e [Candidatus Bathyarchaeia archaeon]
MSLRTQRRMAAEILGVGINRVWMNPDDIEKIESAITKEDVRRLIHEGSIKAIQKRGISGSRRRERLAKGRRKGPGSRKGSRGGGKSEWVSGIRAIRRYLKSMRDGRRITKSVYRRLMLLAKGGSFRSVSHLKEYIEAHKLAKRR